MVAWATKRKLTYLSIVGGALFILVVIPLFLVFYQKPTCFDGKWNGDELGADCGGSCVILCSFETLDPTILWARVFPVSQDMYSAVAYVENSNIASEAYDVSYKFTLYDDQNVLITEREGKTFIPRNKRFAIFEGKIPIGDRKPRSVKFEFSTPPQWLKSTHQEPAIEVRNTALEQKETQPRLEADLVNKSLDPITNIEVTAIIYDGSNNAVGASQTIVDKLIKGGTERAVFTWPKPFATQLEVCEVPADVMLVIDRSGSMKEDSEDPPEPLTSAKNAALSFISNLSSNGRIGVVSFASTPSDPIDSLLTSNQDNLKNRINEIAIIGTPNTQNTNLGDGLLSAFKELQTNGTSGAKKVIVGLTDGIATDPRKAGDDNYPLSYAAKIAEDLKAQSIELYMIGLGNTVNTAYLQSISTNVNHYFGAESGKELKNIYNDIATKICEKRVAIVEVITRILPPQ